MDLKVNSSTQIFYTYLRPVYLFYSQLHKQVNIIPKNIDSQFILHCSFSSPTTVSCVRQIGHPHNFHHQRSPPGEMLRALSRACSRIILLPCESCFLPLRVDVLDDVTAEGGIHPSGLRGVRRGGGCQFLFDLVFSSISTGDRKEERNMEEA